MVLRGTGLQSTIPNEKNETNKNNNATNNKFN